MIRQFHVFTAVAFAAAMGAAADIAQAQSSFPDKPVTLLVGFAPGGSTDIVARSIGEKLQELWKVPVVVENRGGAGGNVAATSVAARKSGGYTILVTTSAFAINPLLSTRKSYDPERDFRSVIITAAMPNLIIAAPGLAAKTLPDVLTAAKKTNFAYGSGGVGTPPHLSAENVFRVRGGAQLTHVPFQGAGPAMGAVAGGHIELACVTMPSAIGLINSGQVKPIAVTSAKRSPSLPDVPTVSELGLGAVDDITWVGFFVSADASDAEVEKINADVNKALKDESVLQHLEKAGFSAVGGTAHQAQEYLHQEIKKWGAVISSVGLKTQ